MCSNLALVRHAINYPYSRGPIQWCSSGTPQLAHFGNTRFTALARAHRCPVRSLRRSNQTEPSVGWVTREQSPLRLFRHPRRVLLRLNQVSGSPETIFTCLSEPYATAKRDEILGKSRTGSQRHDQHRVAISLETTVASRRLHHYAPPSASPGTHHLRSRIQAGVATAGGGTLGKRGSAQ